MNDTISIRGKIVDIDTKKFSLRSHNLTTFPLDIFKLDKLEKLDLSDNMITLIPKRICKLKHLKELLLNGNNILYIPNEICLLNDLRSLILNQNSITDIPKEISQLTHLECISLSTNNIKVVPQELFHLNKLKRLYLHDNKIKRIPLNIPVQNFTWITLFDNDLNYEFSDSKNNNIHSVNEFVSILRPCANTIAKIKIQLWIKKYVISKYYYYSDEICLPI